MPNKKKKRNGFFYFMLDWRKEARKCGLIFTNLSEVQSFPECSEAWQRLSIAEKQRYNDLATTNKLSNNYIRPKLNCRGEPIELLEQKEKELAEFNRKMRDHISNIINIGLMNENLKKVKFYFLHFNWLYITAEHDYVPVEYAIGEFTLQDGIIRYHHKILNIKPKMGYAWQATETSRNGHKILPEFSGGETDFRRLYFEFIDFLKPAKINDDKYPPFFVTKQIYKGVPSFLDQLANAADRINTFTIYSIELLFTALRNAALNKKGIQAISEFIGEREFGTEKYAFEKDIECSYHENIDGGTQFCSLSLIRQWSYIICDYTCDGLEIEYRPGFNCAASLLKDFLYTFENPAKLDDKIKPSKNCREEVIVKTEVKEESSKCRENENQIQSIDNYKNKESQVTPSPIKFERPLRLPNTPSIAVAKTNTKNISDEIPIEDFDNLNIRIARGRASILSRTTFTKCGFLRGRGRGIPE
ncbi:PREDICTED: protein maelstrom 1-like [Polistes dominula]|uniref:Protein maelstrom 1-like n=1 Tax=Polistes dominula TaxID=743375 RepID=A0ABM1IB97_POLDO|nr:PREDICTED: protein maelstrom 1-like [Polistes dominula]